jgi:ubiquinone/menaquinone biosynthesis C-methylase UbiE
MSDHGICPSWLSFSLVNNIRDIFQNPQKMLKDYIAPGSVVADIGCGPGYFSAGHPYFANGHKKTGRLISRRPANLQKVI